MTLPYSGFGFLRILKPRLVERLGDRLVRLAIGLISFREELTHLGFEYSQTIMQQRKRCRDRLPNLFPIAARHLLLSGVHPWMKNSANADSAPRCGTDSPVTTASSAPTCIGGQLLSPQISFAIPQNSGM